MKKNKRLGLSGIYIFEKFEGESKHLPTCIEDCTQETRINWLKTLDESGLDECLKTYLSVITKMFSMLNKEEKIVDLDYLSSVILTIAEAHGIRSDEN